jgi:hypothetical protein
VKLEAKVPILLAIGAASGCCFTPVQEPIAPGGGTKDAGQAHDGGPSTSPQCTIEGTIHSDGDVDPLNPCLYCHAARSTTQWTDSPEGADCATGRHCFGGTCQNACELDGGYVPPFTNTVCSFCSEAGVWTPAADGDSCSLGPIDTVALFCFDGNCQPGCKIDGVARHISELNPQNSCQKCWISNGYQWSNVDPGTSCADGGTCDLNGNCGPPVCTIPSPTGVLEQFANGASKPDDPSLCCSAALKIFDWSPRLVLAQTLPLDGDTAGLAVGDFNGDGWPDLAAITGSASNLGLTIFMNQQGLLQPAFAYAISSGTMAIAAADLNGDTFDDVILGDSVAQTVSVWSSNGDGTFASKVDYAAGPTARGSLQAADFSGDGVLDLVSGVGQILYLQGLGDGGLASYATINDQPGFSTRFGLGDLNGDRTPDIAVASFLNGTGDVFAYLGNGSGGFQRTGTFTAVDLSSNLLVDLVEGDLDGDGFLDLGILTSSGSVQASSLGYLLGFGDGTFGALHSIALDSAAGIVAGLALEDLAGDGRTKLLVASTPPLGGPLSLAGLFELDLASGAVHTVLAGGAARRPVVADFNRDHGPDLVGASDPLLPTLGLNVYRNGCPP